MFAFKMRFAKASLLLTLIAICHDAIGQRCNDHDDCTFNNYCYFAYCVNGVCIRSACRQMVLDCKYYTGECVNRKCVYNILCCCIPPDQRDHYNRIEYRRLILRYDEETKPLLDSERFFRRKKK